MKPTFPGSPGKGIMEWQGWQNKEKENPGPREKALWNGKAGRIKKRKSTFPGSPGKSIMEWTGWQDKKRKLVNPGKKHYGMETWKR
jgi:hypothetical protein